MGYYIEVEQNKNKAEQIVKLFGGEIVHKPNFDNIPADKALIVVVNNGPFEAAALAYSRAEFEEFTLPEEIDPRPRKFVLMDKTLAHKLSGYENRRNR
jgi:hypothetical protein